MLACNTILSSRTTSFHCCPDVVIVREDQLSLTIALPKSRDITFMIAVSRPGEAGVSQVAYLLKSFALCEGTSMEDAVEIQRLCAAVNGARTYDEYVRCAKEMAKHEVLTKRGEAQASSQRNAGILPVRSSFLTL
jgi:hypothetical protein